MNGFHNEMTYSRRQNLETFRSYQDVTERIHLQQRPKLRIKPQTSRNSLYPREIQQQIDLKCALTLLPTSESGVLCPLKFSTQQTTHFPSPLKDCASLTPFTHSLVTPFLENTNLDNKATSLTASISGLFSSCMCVSSQSKTT